MNAFITGSHAYGHPRPDSDVDLVVLVSTEDKQMLASLSDMGKYPVRYGKLNIIVCDDLKKFKVWRDGTEHLAKQNRPYSNKEATDYFDALFLSKGLCKSEDDSGEYE